MLGISLGHMEVEGIGTGEGFELYPGGGRNWDWSETCVMSHSSGCQ
jgi:hypothetical protein